LMSLVSSMHKSSVLVPASGTSWVRCVGVDCSLRKLDATNRDAGRIAPGPY